MQFDRPEFESSTAPAGISCASCKQPLVQSYYEVNGHVICSMCRDRFQQSGNDGSSTARLFKAFFGGLVLATLGGVVWWAVRTFFHIEIAIISIGIGFYVGKFVRRMSGQRGGIAYQIIAVVATYLGICSNYVPDLVAELPAGQTWSFPLVLMIAAITLAAPFLEGIKNFLGILIIGFGLWEAWKLNKRGELTINGPFSVAPAAAPNV